MVLFLGLFKTIITVPVYIAGNIMKRLGHGFYSLALDNISVSGRAAQMRAAVFFFSFFSFPFLLPSSILKAGLPTDSQNSATPSSSRGAVLLEQTLHVFNFHLSFVTAYL